MLLIAETFDLLVHPGYTISKEIGRLRISSESESNIRRVKRLWMDSIEEAAKNPMTYFGIVNSVELPDEEPNEFLNPFRYLYKEIIDYAEKLIGDRLFLFFPCVRPDEIETEDMGGGLKRAKKGGAEMVYDPKTLVIRAYGEHIDNLSGKNGGCVELESSQLANTLGVPQDMVKIDPARSLPSSPCYFSTKPYPGFHVADTMYITLNKLRELDERCGIQI
ncbi:MAG: hypothetical protein QMD85_03360 [Candidatus Aenigmarchaeota archaeon]|nr:hypothetical protein [Candidatus Aenigmarchaeota archaeon]MDI6722581.1 hypothetical protein [Candidatus Aenigmarchaeota archaeon]